MADYEETAYAKRVVEWFERRKWTVYKEVQSPNSNRVVDIYAIKGDKDRPRHTWAVEVKTNFTLRVLEQATHWKLHADRSSIAVPESAPTRLRKFGKKLCRELKLGYFRVVEGQHGPLYADEVMPAYETSVSRYPTLYEPQQDSTAGTNDSSDRYTAFDATVDALVAVAEDRPGVALRDAISFIDHHYKTPNNAYSNLKRIIKDGAIPALRLERRGKVTYVFLNSKD